MILEHAIRVVAGTLVLVSLVLARFVNPAWLYLTAFAGINLIQSAFTGFCPAARILRRVGIGKGTCCGEGTNHG